MKLSISNIAWPSQEDDSFLRLIKKLGCHGVEIAPGLLWPEPISSTKKQRKEYASKIRDFGLEIPAIQALLFSRQDLGIFRAPKIVQETIEYFKALCELAADLGAKVLVYGSPASRERKDMNIEEAFEKSAEVFKQVAPTAHDCGVYFCIEPLRPQETDFITTIEDGLKLVTMVGHPGFSLHLDGKAVSAQNQDFDVLFKKALPELKHFHVNEPELIEINSTKVVKHEAMAQSLRANGYQYFVGIEMRRQKNYKEAVERSLRYAQEVYLNGSSSRTKESNYDRTKVAT